MGIVIYSKNIKAILENEGLFSAARKECFGNTLLRTAIENELVEQVGQVGYDGSRQFQVTEKGKKILESGVERTAEINLMLLGD